MELSPDWTSLPPELLNLICREFSHIPDFFNFRAVCKLWRSSAPLSDFFKGPWILYHSGSLSENLCFFSLSSCKVLTLPLPRQLLGKEWLGPAHDGYLLVRQFSDNGMSLFNPLTNHQVLLPSLDDCLISESFSSLYRSGDFVIFRTYFTNSYKIALFRLGDKNWTYLASHEQYGYDQCICSNGMYFSNSYMNLGTRIVEISTGDLISVVPFPLINRETRIDEPECHSYWIVESFREILMVVLIVTSRILMYFHIYKLMEDSDNKNRSPRWVQTDTIGDCVLFISGQTCVSFKASQFHGLVGNCIYLKYPFRVDGSPYTSYRYNIEDGGIEGIPCTFFKYWHVFVPNLHNL